MINVNVMIDDILKQLKNIKVVSYHPEEFNEIPVVSYYEIASPTGFRADNQEWAQKSYIAIDIWAHSIGECGEIAIEIDRIMQAEGWYREMSTDMPPENNIYQKNMRFYKQIFFETEE